MPFDVDVLIVGSGPAGVAAAWPLVAANQAVAVVDGGEAATVAVPDREYLEVRGGDARQAGWMVGDDGYALSGQEASSPKLRAPTLAYVFRDYARANRIVADGFSLVGSLAVGGLSNAWGCGVARFAPNEWGDAPIDRHELDDAFAAVAARVGVSGAIDDDLSDFFDLDALAEAPLPLDELHVALAGRYGSVRAGLNTEGFRLGRARLAVLGSDRGPDRRACDARGTCLWGCARGSMYSSRFDLPGLLRHASFRHLPGRLVSRVEPVEAGCIVTMARRDGTAERLSARRVVLAAGTLASTAIAMRSLPAFTTTPLLHLPMAAFAVALPRFVGADRVPGRGIAQLAFTLDGATPHEVCGFTFGTHGLPVTEFLRHAPLSMAAGAAVFRALLPSCIVANCFLPARFARSRVAREADGDTVRVVGELDPALQHYAEDVRRRLVRAFRCCGAYMLPGSFTRGAVGADVHYAGTMPMRASPRCGETDADGALAGLPGVHVADGAALPFLPAKSHTLALMANAHRIGARLARTLAAAR